MSRSLSSPHPRRLGRRPRAFFRDETVSHLSDDSSPASPAGLTGGVAVLDRDDVLLDVLELWGCCGLVVLLVNVHVVIPFPS